MSKYKLYYSDTGLLVSALDEEAQEDLRANRNLGVYKGALYENFVAEAFTKQGLGLFYYKKENSSLEEDFFVRTQNDLIPVEVKSNSAQSRSLSLLIKNKNYRDISYGIKLGDFNIGYANAIYTFPYFCTFKLKEYLKRNVSNFPYFIHRMQKSAKIYTNMSNQSRRRHFHRTGGIVWIRDCSLCLPRGKSGIVRLKTEL